jgi:hypothetical protein
MDIITCIMTYNPSTPETDNGGWRIQGQPVLHSKTLSQKKSKINKQTGLLEELQIPNA